METEMETEMEMEMEKVNALFRNNSFYICNLIQIIHYTILLLDDSAISNTDTIDDSGNSKYF